MADKSEAQPLDMKQYFLYSKCNSNTRGQCNILHSTSRVRSRSRQNLIHCVETSEPRVIARPSDGLRMLTRPKNQLRNTQDSHQFDNQNLDDNRSSQKFTTSATKRNSKQTSRPFLANKFEILSSFCQLMQQIVKLVIIFQILHLLAFNVAQYSLLNHVVRRGEQSFVLLASANSELADKEQTQGYLQPPDISEEHWFSIQSPNEVVNLEKKFKGENVEFYRELSEPSVDHYERLDEKPNPKHERPLLRHQRQNHHHSHHHRHHHHRQHHRNFDHNQVIVADEQRNSTKETRGRARRHNVSGFYDNSSAADRPLVATSKGLIRGVTQKTFTGKFVDAFLGIPFAQPPVGRYRFRHPQPINPWTGELDASKLSNSCYQINDTYFGANFHGTSIWNANTPLSEDCLYLNIWTPFGIANMASSSSSAQSFYRNNQRNQQRNSSKRPVLVWIFGGGFYYGTSTLALYEGGVLASEEDIIVVSMNYRVSALGFLYFGRPDSPGNAGLFDQLMALQWINDNIDQFGGDPNQVTIFGESSGAVSVSYHLLSPLSRNLFNQAILQSGAATCPWGYMDNREIVSNGLQLASSVKCPSNSSDMDAVVECLLKVDPMLLVSQEVGHPTSVLNFPFVPVVDGSFLLESPKESLIKSNFKQAKILLGSNYDEGNSFLIYLPEFNYCPSSSGVKKEASSYPRDKQESTLQSQISNDPGVNLPNELRDQGNDQLESLESLTADRQHQSHSMQGNEAHEIIAQSPRGAQAQHNINFNDSNPCKPNENVSITRDEFLEVIRDDLVPYAEHVIGKEAIVFEYTNWNNPHDPISNSDALDKIVGDFYFTCHVNEFANSYANAGNQVFMYYFKQRSSISPWPKWMGVLHGDEIGYVFGEPLNQRYNYSSKEVDLSKRMMRYWANFAKHGNPTKLGENSSMPEKWPEYSDKRQYFELHADYVRVGRGPRAKQCAFWAQYLPKLIDSFDRNQCSDKSKHQNHPFIHPLELDNTFKDCNMRTNFLSTIPSPILMGIFVIIIITIVCLMIYAKRTWKLNLNLGSNNGEPGN